VDKKTIIMAVIAAVVIGGWFFVINPLIAGKKADKDALASPAPTSLPLAEPAKPAETPASSNAVPAKPLSAETSANALAALNADIPTSERTVTLSTDVFEAVFSSKGGVLLSMKAKKHLDKDRAVDLILGGDDAPYFFGTSFGDMGTLIDREIMRVTHPDSMSVEFSRAYGAPGPGGTVIPFILRKTFTFKTGEYMFELKVGIENSVNAVPSLSNKGFAYTLFLGPQIGPKFEKLSNYGETRRYQTFSNGKKKDQKLRPNAFKSFTDRVRWASVTGKYFSLVAVPDATAYSLGYNTTAVPGLENVSQLSLSRPPVSSPLTTDTLRFYLGPNLRSEMVRYSDGKKNSYGYSDLYLEKSIDSNIFIGWLENLLKMVMVLFYKIIPNWGVAIILTTLLSKTVFFPLTLKSSIGTAKMAELQPKMAEIQAKYKDKPERLNQELADFYKREGFNPLSGCLPLLIQLPLFLAMYALFNTHFDLRNALFIPGWIPDLSLPDSILSFKGFTVFNLTFNAIRLLPIIYLFSQLLYGKFTQSNQTPGQNKTQMTIMLYGLPIFFFFILYNAPAGLLVYWITSNVLTIVQQMITNRIIHERKLKAQRS
jgi:YidC/Oxa1 family membrane protein insertase